MGSNKMEPNSQRSDTLTTELEDTYEKLVAPQASPRKYEFVYRNLITFGYMHIAAICGLYLFFASAKWATILFTLVSLFMSALGITAGAHRLWTHRTYKAKLPLEILLVIFNCLALQNSATYWVREHRMHHKYSDTDADPHNATRGFFFSHIGWIFVKKHPELLKRGKFVEMSDIYNNPLLKFQKKYAMPLFLSIGILLPTLIPMYFWGEMINIAWHVNMLRVVFSLHGTFLVNSAAHMWGFKPYDKSIMPAENKTVAFFSLGEGFHNYHHVFPWDYRTAELGNNKLNWTTKFIDFFAWIGWAYDLKTVSSDVIEMRLKRTGDERITLNDKNSTNELEAEMLKEKTFGKGL